MAEERSLLKNSLRVKLLILFSAALLIVFMFPKGESIESEVNIGAIWIQEDLIAPFSFPVYKEAEVYRKELKNSASLVYPVFIKDDNALKTSLDTLKKYSAFLFNAVDSAIEYQLPETFNPTFLSAGSFKTLITLRKKEKLSQGRRGIKAELITFSEDILNKLYEQSILSLNYNQIEKESIAVRTKNIDKIENKFKFRELAGIQTCIETETKLHKKGEEFEYLLQEFVYHFASPNLNYNAKFTAEEIEQVQNKVSRYSGIVTENERIIAKHERVTPDVKLKIDSFKEAKGAKIGFDGLVLQFIGKFLHISFLFTLVSIYIFLFRKKIYHDNSKILLIVINVVFIAFLTFLVNQVNVKAPIQLLIFIPVSSMLLTILFDSRIGFYSTVIIAFVAGALRGNDYTLVAMNICAGSMAVYTVRDIKNRSQIFRSFSYILFGYAIAIFAFGFERFEAFDRLLFEMSFAATSALVSPVLTYGMLIFFERLFNITTDLTLLELSSLDQPLLRELARKAPGTFSHSMTMGTIAENAAESIEANALLVRVGAYYHDIGKIVTPQNFVENQLTDYNVHEALAPEDSVKMIFDHVKMGIKIARENDLPEEVVDFIPMHHGSTVINYFYEKAKTLYGEENVKKESYRYPGPKPNSKETAIIMLADACESTVRTIDEPDKDKVENVIDNIIKYRIEDGQLDESALTFSDIKKIKDAFLNILVGQHHRRIRYPKQDELEKKSGDKEQG
jgi:putative nucleotidyltransferase with HDIG domain